MNWNSLHNFMVIQTFGGLVFMAEASLDAKLGVDYSLIGFEQVGFV